MISTRYSTTAEINRQVDLSAQIAKLQTEISTGNRLSAPSDDPSASARIADIRQTQADQAVWTTNTNTGSAIANAADGNLATVGNLLDRAKELMLTGVNSTQSSDDRATVASELRQIVTQLNTYATASDPTGAPLFPDGTPLAIPVSGSVSLPATASRATVFGSVTTAAGTKSMADILNDAADALVNPDDTARAAATTASLAEIDAGSSHLDQVRADQGVRMQRFTQAKTDLTTSGTALTTERSGLEATDYTYTAAEFEAKSTALQAAQTVFAQAHKSTLFDLLG